MGMVSLVALVGLAAAAGQGSAKSAGVFYPAELRAVAERNAARYPWAAGIRDHVVAAAEPWRKLTDDQLWGLMFGNTIRRSWMVWSNGYCPACHRDVPMYNWRMDALREPWKVRCPHCSAQFPTNDFAAFYRSGLDEHGVFQPSLADRKLLFNAQHPGPGDPLHLFGVDDGEGYAAEGHRWRFIGAYLIYGQWKQAIVSGIRANAAAYVVTRDPAYAHKALVLLDRVADLYPSMDFKDQGVMYEGPAAAGYVSTWHDACEETREMALAYDQVFDALPSDAELVRLLGEKAAHCGLSAKASWQDVQRNIEGGILRDALRNAHRIRSNYPRTEIAKATILTVLGWPTNRAEVMAVIDELLDKGTAVDGVTGEKGLAGYTSYDIQGIAVLLAQMQRLDPGFLREAIARHPRLRETYRFHIDTHCLDAQYYPQVGDTGVVAHPNPSYAGVSFTNDPGVSPSMYTFLGDLFHATGDVAYLQTIHRSNGRGVAELPHDLFARDPDAFQREVADAVRRAGPEVKLGSVNKKEWRLAILRSGKGPEERALWMSYDAGGPHGHANGMNLGLFAKGLDLLPDFGYPPVQYGGWEAPRARWYTMTAAHNTVVVDGKDQRAARGTTTLWADGKQIHAVGASCPELIGGGRYERIAALRDVSDSAFYVLDVFRVEGGKLHTKFVRSHFGEVTPTGIAPSPSVRLASEWPSPAQMGGFREDASAQPGWTAEWRVEDRHKVLGPGRDVRVRYTDLTDGASAGLCESWAVAGSYDATAETWLPTVTVTRRAEHAPLASTFVSVLEPYEGAPVIAEARRLAVQDADGRTCAAGTVGVEVLLRDGARDVWLVRDGGGAVQARVAGVSISTDADLCVVRLDARGAVRLVAASGGTVTRVGRRRFVPKEPGGFVETAVR